MNTDHPKYSLRFFPPVSFFGSSIGRFTLPAVNLLTDFILQEELHKSIPATNSTSEKQVTSSNDDIGVNNDNNLMVKTTPVKRGTGDQTIEEVKISSIRVQINHFLSIITTKIFSYPQENKNEES